MLARITSSIRNSSRKTKINSSKSHFARRNSKTNSNSTPNCRNSCSVLRTKSSSRGMKTKCCSSSWRRPTKLFLNFRIKLTTRSTHELRRIEVLKLGKLLEKTNKHLVQNRIIEILKLRPEQISCLILRFNHIIEVIEREQEKMQKFTA